MPTQEAYWYLPWGCCVIHTATHCAHSRGILYLPWDCCLIGTPIHCSHSRGIRILAGTCCISTALSSPHSRSNAVRCMEAPLFYFLVIVTIQALSQLVPSQETILFIVVDLSLLFLVLNIWLIFTLFLISYGITSDHKYLFIYPPFVATHLVCHMPSLYIYIRKFGVKSLFKAYFIKINTIFSKKIPFLINTLKLSTS